MDISVIIATYNSDITKLKNTLSSILCQKNVNFEIIIADDGSITKNQSLVKKLIENINADNIKTILNKENEGTIKNLYKAVCIAQGEYIFTIGPGDLLFDPYVLHDIVEMALHKQNCGIFFGKAVYYCNTEKNIKVFDGYIGKPKSPNLYDDSKSVNEKKIAFFFGNFIIGAAYLRKKEMAIRYFKKASEIGVYAEDMLSTSIALAENENIIFLDRNVLWYEFGTGISTSLDLKWTNILNSEYDKLYDYLSDKFPDDRIIRAAKYSHYNPHVKRILYRMFNFPELFWIEIKQKFSSKNKMKCSESEKKYLIKLLNDNESEGNLDASD